MRAFPVTIAGLIEELESLYPPRCIGPEEVAHTAHRYAGKVELIAELKGRYDAANKRELKQGDLPTVL